MMNRKPETNQSILPFRHGVDPFNRINQTTTTTSAAAAAAAATTTTKNPREVEDAPQGFSGDAAATAAGAAGAALSASQHLVDCWNGSRFPCRPGNFYRQHLSVSASSSSSSSSLTRLASR